MRKFFRCVEIVYNLGNFFAFFDYHRLTVVTWKAPWKFYSSKSWNITMLSLDWMPWQGQERVVEVCVRASEEHHTLAGWHRELGHPIPFHSHQDKQIFQPNGGTTRIHFRAHPFLRAPRMGQVEQILQSEQILYPSMQHVPVNFQTPALDRTIRINCLSVSPTRHIPFRTQLPNHDHQQHLSNTNKSQPALAMWLKGAVNQLKILTMSNYLHRWCTSRLHSMAWAKNKTGA